MSALHITGLLCGILVLYTSAHLLKDIRDGCDLIWERNNNSHTCYQFNLQSLLSWKAARKSCQAQGGDLLSIEDLAEHKYISAFTEKMKNADAMLWIGLNQLDVLVGWQWSDGSALALVNWKTNFTPWSNERKHCGAYDAGGDHKWRGAECESRLPYACKKYLTPRRQAPNEENRKCYRAQCESGWTPYIRRCYRLLEEEFSWSDASAACLSQGGELMVVNSLADLTFLLHLFNRENVSEAWIGMRSKQRDPVEFQWWDGSAVTFSSWQRHEPNISLPDSDLCVSAQRNDGHWRVRPCDRKLSAACRKPALQETMDVSDEQCAKDRKKDKEEKKQREGKKEQNQKQGKKKEKEEKEEQSTQGKGGEKAERKTKNTQKQEKNRAEKKEEQSTQGKGGEKAERKTKNTQKQENNRAEKREEKDKRTQTKTKRH